MVVCIDLPNIYFKRHNYEKMAVLAVIEHISESTLFFRTIILNQFSCLYIEIPAQLTYQSSIESADTITAVFIEICSWNIKVFTDFILANTLLVQYFIYS